MAVIEGYTFAVDMQDRGVVTTLRQMKTAASAMKAEMRAGFETIQHGEGSLSAYNNRLEQSQRLIDNYKNMQASLRKELESLNQAREKEIATNGRVTDATEKQYDKVARNIENYQHQINRLRQSQREAREAIAQLNTGLARSRTETENVKNVTQSYVRAIDSQGRAFATSKAQAQAYRTQHQALNSQYRAEVAETSRLSSQLDRLKTRYSYVKANVDRLKASNQTNSAEYSKMSGRMRVLSENIDRTNAKMSKQVASALQVRASINEISRSERSVTDGGITRLSRAMNNLDANARRATSHTREWASGLRGGLIGITAAAAPMGYAIGGAVKSSAELGNQWVQTKNYLYTGADSAKEARSEVAKLSDMQRDAKKYSNEYGYSQKDIATQYGELVKRGYTARQSLGSMKAMLEASRASGDDYDEVVKNVSNAVDAFGMRSNNTAKMLKATNQVTNDMAFSADKTATDFRNMGYAMSYVSSVAKGAGFDVRQTAAAIGVLSNSGIEGTLAGTGLRKTINSLTSPTKGATEAMKKYGMSFDDFKTKSGSLKSLPKIMSIINKHVDHLGKANKAAFFKAVFGTTGMQAASILARHSAELQKLNDQEKQAEKDDYVGKLAKKQMASTQMQMQLLKTRVQNLGIVIGNRLLPYVNKVGTAFNSWLKSKDGKNAVKDLSDATTDLGKAIGNHSGGILKFFTGFVEGLSGVIKVAGVGARAIGGVASAIGKLPGFKGNGGNFAKWSGEAVGAILGIIGAFKLFKTTVNGMSAVRQDIRNLFHLDGMDKENSKIGHENQELKENIRLWERHNEVSGGDSAVGSDITSKSSKENAPAATTGEKGAKESAQSIEREAGPAMEEAGKKSGGFFSHGLGLALRKGGRFGADVLIQTLTMGILDFDMVKLFGGKIVSSFKSVGRKIKGIKLFPDSRSASNEGRKAGSAYADGVTKSATRGNKKISTKKMFQGTTEEAKSSGTKAGSNFAENVTRSATKGSKRISGKELFHDTAKEAGESGAKTGTSFLSRLGQVTRSSKLLGMGRFIGTKMGGAATVAFGAVDLFAELGSSSKKNRAKAVGRSLGTTAGGAIGAGIGGTLGSVLGPVGTAAGTLLGGALGGAAGRKIGGFFGKLWPKIKKGAAITFRGIGKVIAAPFEWVGKRFDSLRKKMSGGRGKSTIGAGNYSAKDRQLVQKMTKAVNGYARSLKALKKVNMRNYFKDMGREIQKSKLVKELSSLDKTTRQSAKNWRNLAKPMRTVTNSFKSLQKAVRNLSGRRNGFSALNRDIQTLYRTIRRNPFGKLIAQQANIANRALSGKKSGFVNEFNRQTRSMERSLRSFRRTFTRDWEDTWRGLSRPVSRNLSEAYRAERRSLDDMESARSKFSNSFLKGWDSWIDSVTSNFRRGFDKLPGYAQSSMKDIISRLNKGISGINSTISSFGGDKKLSSISYANGTQGGHPGGHMLVNDSVRPHWKELVLFPNGQALLPQHRNTLIPNAPRGTQVLSGENTYKFMNSIGVHKYANGTLSESEMDKLSEEFQDHPEQASKELILKYTNWNSKVPVVADLGEASAVAFARGIANVLKDQMASEANPPGSGVARWRPYIIRAFHALGYEAAEWKVNKLLKQIETESGGNPTIPQQIQDKNSGGNESLGLLQFAKSTWEADALPGHKNRASGYDQILAAISVLEKGGEGGWGNVGMGHGWATGGFATRHGLYEVAEHGLPEAIIPFDINKRPRALSLIDHTLDKMESDGGGTGGLRSRASQARADSENTTYLKQAVSILAQIAGLNKQQIDAILTHGNDDMDSRHKRARFYQKFGNDQRVNDYMSY